MIPLFSVLFFVNCSLPVYLCIHDPVVTVLRPTRFTLFRFKVFRRCTRHFNLRPLFLGLTPFTWLRSIILVNIYFVIS